MIKRCLLCDECEEFGGILSDDGSADEAMKEWLAEHEEWRECDGEFLCGDCAAAFDESQDDEQG